MRYGARILEIRLRAHPAQARPGERPDPSVMVGPQSQAVAEKDPLETHQAYGHEALRQNGENVFLPDQSAIEEGQSWDHKKDKRRAEEHPSRIARIEGDEHGFLCHLR